MILAVTQACKLPPSHIDRLDEVVLMLLFQLGGAFKAFEKY